MIVTILFVPSVACVHNDRTTVIEIMRQKDDQQFTELLNRFRPGSQTEHDINCVNSRSISPLDDNHPSDALHIWAENDPVNEHNNKQLQQLHLHHCLY